MKMKNNPKENKSLYIEDYVTSVNKKRNVTCGDYCLIKRNSSYTDFILCDGMGSGPKANTSAIMCATRILTLMENGISIYDACKKAVCLMHRARTENIPFAAFSVVRIMKTGQFISLSYEISGPLMLYNGVSTQVKQKYFPMAGEIVSESIGIMPDGASLIFCSDGVTQAGLGIIKSLGIGIDGFCNLINKELAQGESLIEIPKNIIKKTYELSGNCHVDDTTIAILTARPSNVLSLLTGPPVKKTNDREFIKKFMNSDGKKVVCGSTTADIVSRELGEEVETPDMDISFTKPPSYTIKGLDLVTEGAITLNQLYNILDEPIEHYDSESCVSELAKLIKSADIINIFIGKAKNEVHGDISFKQGGILERHKILELLISKFVKAGKIVNKYEM